MTTPVNVANIALGESGSRVYIGSFTDTSPQAQTANLFYTPKTQALLRAANWDFARAQVTLTVWKEAVVNGAASANPPPQPFLYSYLWPSDCLRARFLLPTLPIAPPGTPLTTAPIPMACAPPARTSTPFVVSTDFDANGNPIKTILANLPAAQLVYTRDLSQVPDLWDALFLSAETAFLAAYFINALTRNAAQYNQQAAAAKSALDQARISNGNEAIANIDHFPDWNRARHSSGLGWWFNGGAPGVFVAPGGSFDQLQFPDGLFY